MALTTPQFERYKRHIFLREIGAQGQQRLLRSRVLLIGLGGLGCPILAYLVAGGVGHIGLVDDDVVERSNLQRQILFNEADPGRLKVEAARDFAQAQNADVSIEPYPVRVASENSHALIAGYDLVIEGVDNFETRYILNTACLAARIPFLSAAIGRFDGQVALFEGYRGGKAPCYRCLVPEAPVDISDCETEGVLGAVAGMVGSFAATRALLHLAGDRRRMTGPEPAMTSLYLIDCLSGAMRSVGVVKDENCEACRPFADVWSHIS